MNSISQFFNNFKQRCVVDDLKETGEFSPMLISYHESSSYIAQQYAQIAAAFINNQAIRKAQSIVFTSPQPADGKSTTIANLAVSLAQDFEQKVLIIDADWRRPTQQNFFRTENRNQQEPQKTAIKGLDLIYVPEGIDGKSHWLETVQELLSQHRYNYDKILIDTAPILKVTDAAQIGAEADALILLVKAQDTSAGIITEAVEVLGNLSVEVSASILVNRPNYVDVYNYVLNPHYRRYYSNYYEGY